MTPTYPSAHTIARPLMPGGMHQRRFGSEVDVELMTGIKRKTLQKHRLMGTGPKYYKLGSGTGRGGAVKYDLDEVIAWIESGAVNPSVR